MNVAFVLHPSVVNSPIDPLALDASTRGLTGSENSCIGYAQALNLRGHGVSIYSCFTEAAGGGGLHYWPYEEWEQQAKFGWDAVFSWMVGEPLRHAPSGARRVLNMQYGDFGLSGDWEPHTDILCSLSRHHAAHLATLTGFDRAKYRVMPNGVDRKKFRPGTKVPGRCVWASSHDRGLHHLLECWPRVKAQAPHATLRVFYSVDGMVRLKEGFGPGHELGRRSIYCIEQLEQLRPLGVEFVGGVSRERMAEEFAMAEFLAYPCDPFSYTETFGVSVLEAMASGCVPVLALADSFEELWKGACWSCDRSEIAEQYEPLLSTALFAAHDHGGGDLAHRTYRRAGTAVASNYDWDLLGSKLEDFIASRGATGLEMPW